MTFRRTLAGILSATVLALSEREAFSPEAKIDYELAFNRHLIMRLEEMKRILEDTRLNSTIYAFLVADEMRDGVYEIANGHGRKRVKTVSPGKRLRDYYFAENKK